MANARAVQAISERQFATQVEDLFRLFGWRYYHTWRSDHSPAGFPDYVAVRPPRLLFVELKTDAGNLTKAQREWQDSLARSVDDSNLMEVSVWRPRMLEHIAECLR